MFITEIKAAIAAKKSIVLPSLMMVRQENEDGTPSEWLSHWDNDNRVRITMHENVMKTIKDGGEDAAKLAFKHEIVAPHLNTKNEQVAQYDRFVVITPKNVEAVF